MDFFNKLAKQLSDMEEQARFLQDMEINGATLGPDGKMQFQPRGKQPKQTKKQQRSQGGGGKKSKKGQGRQPPGDLVSREEVFETPRCATEGSPPVTASGIQDSAWSRLVDTLYGRCDEAFLLSEILGPPRCVKGWEE